MTSLNMNPKMESDNEPYSETRNQQPNTLTPKALNGRLNETPQQKLVLNSLENQCSQESLYCIQSSKKTEHTPRFIAKSLGNKTMFVPRRPQIRKYSHQNT